MKYKTKFIIPESIIIEMIIITKMNLDEKETFDSKKPKKVQNKKPNFQTNQ